MAWILATKINVRRRNPAHEPSFCMAPMPPAAAIREALRLLSALPAEEFQADAALNCIDHAQHALAATR